MPAHMEKGVGKRNTLYKSILGLGWESYSKIAPTLNQLGLCTDAYLVSWLPPNTYHGSLSFKTLVAPSSDVVGMLSI